MFADAGGRLLLWPFTAAADSSGSKSSSSSKYTVLLESVGSKVVCLAAAPASSTPHSTQQLQQVRLIICFQIGGAGRARFSSSGTADPGPSNTG